MFNELKVVKYFKGITDFQGLIIYFKEIIKHLKKESSKHRGLFRTQASI